MNIAALASAFLLLLAVGHQYADAFAVNPRGFGNSASGGVGSKSKKRLVDEGVVEKIEEVNVSPSVSPVMAAYALSARGAEMQQQGRLNGAVSAFTEALALHPTADRRFLLAMALEENGEPHKAVAMYDWACQSHDAGADAILRHDAAIKLADLCANDLGDVERAIRYVDAAMAEDGYEHSTFSNAAAFDQKAFYLAEQGNLGEAILLWDAAIEGTEEGELVTHNNMGEEAVSRAVARSHLGRFFRAVTNILLGHDQEAEAAFATLPVECQYMVDSWNYIATTHYPQEQHVLQSVQPVQQNGRRKVGRLFTGPFTILEEALASARPNGLVCEFGVFHGKSIRILASMVGQDIVDGFDTFEGIPEAWGDDPAGTYTAAAEIPPVPDNVRFHVGLFSDTLPGYVASLEPPEDLPVRLINVDCDLYQGTVEILHHLANRIGPGCVICFDEYLMTPTWPEDEYKAFQEACAKFKWEYEYLSFSLFSKQVVVRITASESFVG